MVTTLAGSGQYGQYGHDDGQGRSASFSYPYGVAVDTSGNVYVADSGGNDLIRKITSSGHVTTIAGTFRPDVNVQPVDGISGALSIAVDKFKNTYVGTAAGTIWKIDSAGVLSKFFISNPYSNSPTRCFANEQYISSISGLTVDPSGNFYLVDGGCRRILKVNPSGVATPLAGGGLLDYSQGASNFFAGFANGFGSAAKFLSPNGIAVDSLGNIYVADTFNYSIRKITPDGLVSTLAGSGKSGHTDGTGTNASFESPTGVAVDSSGNVYVADRYIRKITPKGVVTTLAGKLGGYFNAGGNIDGIGSTATVDATSLTIDSSDNIYVAQQVYVSIRKITFVKP